MYLADRYERSTCHYDGSTTAFRADSDEDGSIVPELPTGNRRDDHQRIIGIDNRIDTVTVADIFLIQVDIDKTAQLLAIVQVLA